MYIWVGCALPKEFENTVRGHVLENAGDLMLDFSGFSLPQHISLKISFEAGEAYEKVLDLMEQILRCETKLSVVPGGIDHEGRILWIRFLENPRLQQLHGMLDSKLQERFGISQHPFDRNFIFHSTLCMGEAGDVRRMEERLCRLVPLEEMVIDTFLLGVSETNASGSFRVVRKILAKTTE